MEKFINNNLENEFETEREIAEDLKEILDEEDYLEYIEYFVDTSYDILLAGFPMPYADRVAWRYPECCGCRSALFARF